MYTEHVMGVTRALATEDYSWCPFGSKSVRYCKMQKNRAKKVIYYGWEGGEVQCDEFVPVLPKSLFDETFGDKDLEFLYSPNCPRVFHQFAVALAHEIMKRVEPGDVVLNFAGSSQKKTFDLMEHTDCLKLEASIGYGDSFAKYRVYESHAKRTSDRGSFARYWDVYNELKQYRLVKPDANDGEFSNMLYKPDVMIPAGEAREYYDTVIEGFMDPDEFAVSDEAEDYLMFIGRIIPSKGIDNAVRIAEILDMKLIVAGHGNLEHVLGRKVPDCVEYVGHLKPEERREYQSKALAGLVLTEYDEPFGNVIVEFNMCDRPVIASNKGAFSHTVLDGVTGFRGESLNEYVTCVKQLDKIKKGACRKWALDNFSILSQGEKYDEYFESIRFFEAHKENKHAVDADTIPPVRFSRKYPVEYMA